MAEAELATIARPYARAAFAHALDQADGLSRWSGMLTLLARAVAAPPVREALDNPLLTTADEAALLLDLAGDELSDGAKQFIRVLAEYGRLALLPTIAQMFELLKANHEKTMAVEVLSAFEVSDAEKAALSHALRNRLQRRVHLETHIDASLIGGVVIRAEDTVIDDSVRGRLARMAQALH